ncbi:protealysin inhibitor emfourin [Frankia sp. R82]|uniref:protealysin inhibitor emfourin n=1 Tax=Frankia sp. R82 TaxID=2950553 RepID=UPI002043A485|nr:protealysin inhibitor emfourin [Frankia sp. R82]MCM3886772.1 hypothetical protein [Frankia sp. R82]
MNANTDSPDDATPPTNDPTMTGQAVGNQTAGDPAPQMGGVRVAVVRAGGVLGVPIRRTLDTSDLPDAEADQLRVFVARALDAVPADATSVDSDLGTSGRPGSPDVAGAGSTEQSPRHGGADRFSYVVEIREAGRRTVLTVNEPVPAAVRPLLDLLRTAPVAPRADL